MTHWPTYNMWTFTKQFVCVYVYVTESYTENAMKHVHFQWISLIFVQFVICCNGIFIIFTPLHTPSRVSVVWFAPIIFFFIFLCKFQSKWKISMCIKCTWYEQCLSANIIEEPNGLSLLKQNQKKRDDKNAMIRKQHYIHAK